MKNSNINKSPVLLAFSFNQLRVTRIVRICVVLAVFFLGVRETKAQKLLTKGITLQMPGGGGANACAIVWHPTIKKYYTSMIGNANFSMAVFDATGKKISDSMSAGYDLRGMWYNPISKRIEFNCYDDYGWGHLTLDVKGTIKGKVLDFEGQNQPTVQSTGVYYPKGNKVLFFNPETYKIELYNAKTAYFDTSLTKIWAGCKTLEDTEELEYDQDEEEERWYDRNLVVQYTGKLNQEIAVLNTYDRLIELYSFKTGLITDSYKIPDGITLYTNFNFTYCNSIWWLFNKDARRWEAYKVPVTKTK